MKDSPTFSPVLFDRVLQEQAETCVEQCCRQDKTLSFAESCTGGLLSALITSVSGSSAMFQRSFITYSNEAKQTMLGIDGEVLRTYGAVSSQCAKAMAENCLACAQADLSVSVTGIAGPTGGTNLKPVGLVYIALSFLEGNGSQAQPTTTVNELRFGSIPRDIIRQKTAYQAFNLINEHLALLK